jgi:DNA polymerase-3 subunit alpha
LAYSGALDEFGDRTQIAENYEVISGFAKNIEKSKSGNVDQTDLFGMSDQSNDLQQKLKLKAVSPLTLMEKLKKEKDYLGLYVSSTPLKGLGRYLKSKAKFIGDFTEKDLDKTHKVAGLLTSIKTLITKAGSPMAYAELEDATSKINVVIFPKVYQEYKFKIKEDQVMKFVNFFVSATLFAGHPTTNPTTWAGPFATGNSFYNNDGTNCAGIFAESGWSGRKVPKSVTLSALKLPRKTA